MLSARSPRAPPARIGRAHDPGYVMPSTHMLRALRSRNYRLFFSGQFVSLVGTWITRVATSWLVYRLSHSAFQLGMVGFWGLVPTLVLAPFAGVLMDRWDRHRVIVWTQVLSALQSAALAWLTFAGTITITQIMVLQAAQGIINAFDTPARQAFVVEMIEDRADLPNAIALNSSMFNGSRIIGPSIGGLVIAAVGEGWCFAIDALSYVAVIVGLLLMHLVPRERTRKGGNVREELREGFRYVAGFPPVRSALLLLSMVSVMGMPYTTLAPAIASTVLHGGAHTLGFLMTASGFGALVGALFLAARRSVVGIGRVLVTATLVLGASLIAFALSRALPLSLLLLVGVGAGMMMTSACTNTFIQTVVPEALRGRVMSFYTVAFLGTAPIGSLLAGVVADRIGAPRTVLWGGAAVIAAGVWGMLQLPRLRAHVRPVYIERGILVANQVETESGR